MDETERIECLGHSNRTICSPLSPFSSDKFPFVTSLYWEANPYYPRGLIVRKGNSPHYRNGWDRRDWVLGAFKLDHLQPLKPILFRQFSICHIFILGGQFLLPQRVNSEQVKSHNSRIWWGSGFWVQPFNSILFWQFSICRIFILGGQ